MKKVFYILLIAVFVILLLLSFLWKKGFIGMRMDPTNEEMALLSNSDKLNEALSQHRFDFTNKKIQKTEISGLGLSDAGMNNLEIIDSSIRNSKLEKVEISNVDFIDFSFLSSEIRDAIFNNCTFTRSTFKDVKLVNTKFKDCKFVETRFENVNADKCEFINNTSKDLRFYRSSLLGCKFSESKLNDFSIIKGMADYISFNKNEIEKLEIQMDRIRELEMIDTKLSGSVSSEEVEKEIRLLNCTGGVGINDTKLPKIVVEKCDYMESFSITKVEVDNMVVDCKKIDVLSLNESKIRKIEIKNANIDMFDIDSIESAFDMGYFVDIKFNGFGVIKSTVKNLTIENTTISQYLVLRNATFDNLKMKNVSVDAGVKYVEEDVQYINSMKFPVKK